MAIYEDELGQYASDRFLHHGDSRLSYDQSGAKDYRGDGDLGFHQENVFGQNERDPGKLEQLFGYGEGYVVTRDIVGDIRDESAADDWMRQHGHRW